MANLRNHNIEGDIKMKIDYQQPALEEADFGKFVAGESDPNQGNTDGDTA